MRQTVRIFLFAAGAAALIATAAIAATMQENFAAYQRRDLAMMQLGRNLYVSIGRVVQGRSPYGPEAVSAAEAVMKLLPELPTLFPPGSDVPGSKMDSSILDAGSNRDALIAAVQKAAAGLVPAVQSGNRQAMGSAYSAVADACNACHSRFRNND